MSENDEHLKYQLEQNSIQAASGSIGLTGINALEAEMRDRLATIEDLSLKLEEARGRIGEMEARLEIDHEFEFDPEKRDLVRVDIPPEQRSFAHDGIACRDATITLQEEAITEQHVRIAELCAAIKPFVSHGRALGVYSGAEGPFWINTDTGHRDIPAEDFRTARTVLEGKSE